MPSTSLLYRTLARSAVAIAPLAGRRRPKIQAGIAGRAGVLQRMAEWAGTARDPARPLLWMHAASRGEAVQAAAVLERLQPAHPEWQIAFTYFSPSAAELIHELPVDFSDYLPWDRRSDVDAALATVQPAAVIFSKLDLWPELATRAARFGAAVGIIGAAVSPDARRLRWPARALSRPGYQAVSAAGAARAEDVERLVALGVSRERIELTGDPRFDAALQRARRGQPEDPLRKLDDRHATLVAGSTWPPDEDVLLAALRVLRGGAYQLRLVLVPHEPTAENLARLDQAASAQGLPLTRLSQASGPAEILVVDRVGILPTLYAGARIAYVGGGFGTDGLHSVLEPAAYGLPVIFGPEGRHNPDGAALLQRRAAAVVSLDFPDWLDVDAQGTFAGLSPLAALWLAMLRHPGHLRDAGRRALEYVEAGAGGAARNAGLVERLMQRD